MKEVWVWENKAYMCDVLFLFCFQAETRYLAELVLFFGHFYFKQII